MKRTFMKISVIVFLFVTLISPQTVSANSSFVPPIGSFVVSDKETTLVPGVIESEVVYNNSKGSNPVAGFIVDIDLNSNAKIMAASKNYNQSGTQTVMKMAEATIKETDRNIVAGINADLNWSGTGLSNGPLIIDGKIYTQNPDNFFGITKDGEAVIGDGNKFTELKNNLEHAVRGMGWLVRDGVITDSGQTLAPRTAVGIKADGSVFFYVVEGRNYPRSVGISLNELAQVMLNYGAVDALNLDGGGSTTYIAKREGEKNLSVKNIPSDGVERESISSLFVYSIVGDGQFDHAYISSDYDIYTPNSEVQFSALGVDNAGGSAPLPSNLSWKVANSSFGTIDSNGKFVSNGTEGEVIIQLLDSASKVVGEGTIEVRIPNEIQFLNEEYSLGFDEVTDFGLRLTYNQRDVSFKDGDIVWDFDEKLGVMTNNVFTSNSEESVQGAIKATVSGSTITKEITVDIGKLPIIIFDFENDLINEKWNASAVNGAQSTISIVDKDSGEPVRFGNQSLRVDFDFTTQTRNPGGAYAGFSDGVESEEDEDDYKTLEELGVTFQLPGAPTGVGMWIYGTEEVQGLWLRTGIGVEGNTNWKAFDLAPELIGIDWLGWKYVEVDLTDFAGPYTILQGQFIRLMLTANSFDGQPLRPVGNIYVDNITVTYGTNVDDTDSPVIDYLLVNSLDVDNGDVLNSNNITVEAAFGDIVNKYTSGIDYESVSVYVDGVNYRDTELQALNQGENTVYLQNVNLTDGTHEIKVVVSDFAGNEVSESRYITIDTSTHNKVYLEGADSVVLGEQYEISLMADEIDNLDSVFTSLRISRTLEDYEIEFSSAFEGTVQYLNGVQLLNIQANRINEDDVDYVFKIKSKIATNLNENAVATYSMNIGSFEYINDQTDERFLKGYSKLPQNLGIAAPIKISSNTILVGHEAIFSVTDFEGNPLENAKIYEIISGERVELGETDENGNFVTDIFSEQVVSFVLVAEHEERLSFEFNGQSFTSTGEVDGAPFAIHLNGTKNPHSSKNISWLSNVEGNQSAFVEYALRTDFDVSGVSAFVNKEGTLARHTFTGSLDPKDNSVVNINNVVITGLSSGKEYVYRVGNGEVWSEIQEFSTVYQNSDSTFLIIGDIQTEDYEGFRNDLAGISNNNIDYDFSVQIGDLVDDAGTYSNWHEILTVIEESGISHLDMIQVLGNHEYYGDVSGAKAAEIFNFPSESLDYYSVEYQNVYFGVINYTMSRSRLLEALNWLVEDASKSNSTWKVLLTHQPPYYLNPQGGNELFNELLPQYVQEAGIDFVFSGHDHAYARTEPLIDGQPADDGVVYIVTGALGEKRYTSVNNPDFHFATVNDTFDSIYLTVQTTQNSFSITTKEVGTGEVIDSYTKSYDSEDDIKYILNGDRLISEDGQHNRPVKGFTGLVSTVDGDEVYLINGDLFNGFLLIEGVLYYFNQNGVSQGEVTKGFYVIPKGTVYINDNGDMVRGWQEIDGFTYYFSTTDGLMRTGSRYVGDVVYDFAEDGKLLDNEGNPVVPNTDGFVRTKDGIVYIADNGEMLYGWQEIDGYTYYFSTSNGVMRSGNNRYVGGRVYDFSSDGKLLDDQGNAVVKDFGFIETDAGIVYISESGEMLTDWQEIAGDTYYFSRGNGVMRTGLNRQVGTKKYDFTDDGKLIGEVNPPEVDEFGFIETEAGIIYITEAGEMLTEWQEIADNTYYFSRGNGVMRTGLNRQVGTKKYDFTDDGKLIGEVNPPEEEFGFTETEAGTIYINESGEMLTEWHEIAGDTYYFSRGNGIMRTGLNRQVGTKKYDFADDGKLIGEVIPPEVDEFGFVETEAGTIYINESGEMLTEWQEIAGDTYYFSRGNGVMRTGLNRQVGTKKYDFTDDGKLIAEVGMNANEMNLTQDKEKEDDSSISNDSTHEESGLSTDDLKKETIFVSDEDQIVIKDSLNFKTMNNLLYYHDDEFIIFIGFVEVSDGLQYFSLVYHDVNPDIAYVNGSPVNWRDENIFVFDELVFDFKEVGYVVINEHKYVFDEHGIVIVDENINNFVEEGSDLLDLLTVEGDYLNLFDGNYHIKEDAAEIFNFLNLE